MYYASMLFVNYTAFCVNSYKGFQSPLPQYTISIEVSTFENHQELQGLL